MLNKNQIIHFQNFLTKINLCNKITYIVIFLKKLLHFDAKF